MSNFSLPDDLFLDVLSWLPVKSLSRFKQVSKSWCSLIESREFAKINLNRLKITDSNSKLVYRIYNKARTADFYIRDCKTNVVKQLVFPISRNLQYSLIGSSNGVICAQYNTDVGIIIFWNPLSQNYREVLLPSSPNLHASDHHYGFGYVKTSDDYKYVVLVKFSDKNLNENYYGGWIYSLKRNIWKRVHKFSYVLNNYIYGKMGINVSGALHWITDDSRLLAYDLATEEFNIVSQPNYSDDIYSRNLGIYGDCLSLMCKSKTDYFYQLWVMKDYGITDSWTRIDFEFPCDKGYWFLVPIAYIENSKQIVFQDGKDLYLYDLEKQSIHKVCKHDDLKVFAYFETLECFDGAGTTDEINARVASWNERIRRIRGRRG